MSTSTSTTNAGVPAATHDGTGNPYLEMDLLRFTTAGSVDDGKSTLIGRLLYDTKSIFQDQLEAIERSSKQRGEELNLALLTDGLRAEREQNITIDVAYRYFATPRRKFIIADTPGHLQYTRNMVTGASTAELAIVLVDARKGVQTQSKRHGFISSLLGTPHIVLAVNKMDVVGYAQDVFDRIADEYRAFAEQLDVKDLVCIPVSALLGDNIVTHSPNMPWYEGATLLHHLENVNVGAAENHIDFRFPVQYVIRPHQDFRGFAGRVASGSIAPGEEIVALPSGIATRVKSVEAFEGPVAEASSGDSVVITIADEVDISRGDMLVRRNNVPRIANRLEAMLCWMSETPLDPAARYVVMHTTRQGSAFVSKVHYRIDVDTLHREPTDTLQLNEIGRVEITTSTPLFFDPYAINHLTGSFILVDAGTNTTVAAGMIRAHVTTADEAFPTQQAVTKSPDVVWEPWNVPREAREARNRHQAAVLWFTGLSGSGKSTIARALERRLFEMGCQTMLLDGDQLRHGLNGDLGFGDAHRTENIRRAGEVARLFFEHGNIVICTFVSPFAADRARVRSMIPEGRFYEIFVDCDIEECKRRDPKGLYAKAERGEIASFTGVSSPYEKPEAPDLVIDTATASVESAVNTIAGRLQAWTVKRSAGS